MSEQHFHDSFYGEEAAAILSAPLFLEVRRRILADLNRSLGLRPESTLLSLGCGTGDYEIELGRTVAVVVGMDISQVAVGIAEGRRKTAELDNVSFLAVDVLSPELRLPAAPFDAICALGFFHHFTDQAIPSVLAFCLRNLKPGGRVYSIDPSARRLVRLAAPLFTSKVKKLRSEGERELEPECLRSAFERAGFSSALVGYCEFFLGSAAWALPWIPGACVPWLSRIDAVLASAPIVQRWSSGFTISAQRT